MHVINHDIIVVVCLLYEYPIKQHNDTCCHFLFGRSVTFHFVTVDRNHYKYGSRQARNSRKKLECISQYDRNCFRLLKAVFVISIFMTIPYGPSSEVVRRHQLVLVAIWKEFGQPDICFIKNDVCHEQ